MTTALFMLRAAQCGIAVRDLELLTFGMVTDMFAESLNDTVKYPELAQQTDFDKF